MKILVTISPRLLPFSEKERGTTELIQNPGGDSPDLKKELNCRPSEPSNPEDWIKHCVALTRSARPPDSVTAAYMLRILAATSNAQDTLKIIQIMSDELSSQVRVALDQGKQASIGSKT